MLDSDKSYKVNEQGMVVEEMDESDGKRADEKVHHKEAEHVIFHKPVPANP